MIPLGAAQYLALLLVVGVGLITLFKTMILLADWWVQRNELHYRKPEGKAE